MFHCWPVGWLILQKLITSMSINYVCTSVCFSLTLIENCYICGILHTSITFWSFHFSYLSNWIVIVNLSTTWTSLVTNGLLVTSDQLSFTLHMTSCMSDKFSVYLQEEEQKYYNYSKIRQNFGLVSPQKASSMPHLCHLLHVNPVTIFKTRR